MDITKFFEPVQKFVTYLVDRVTIFLITCALIHLMVRSPGDLNILQKTYYPLLVGLLDGIGIPNESRHIFLVVALLFILVSILELHEKILTLLNQLAPIQFMDHIYSSQDIFNGHASLIWRGYCKKLDLDELATLFRVISVKIGAEMAPTVQRREIFDFAPAWFLLLMLFYVFAPSDWIDIGPLRFIVLLAVILAIGFLWRLYAGRDRLGHYAHRDYLTVAAMLASKIHDYEPFEPAQLKRLEELHKHMAMQGRSWRTVKPYSPWVGIATDSWQYFRARQQLAKARAAHLSAAKTRRWWWLHRFPAGRIRFVGGRPRERNDQC